ncbi:NUDIX domain-containing protein [Bogoriella caseilytica]|uniref:NUDIX domain-containing protein n=1 Tax=Bogoriella caseilytica TaxID=56055 RepID=UPI001FE9FBA1|nr:NUDIX hydrolase [Bogoriella caseilytica]
MTDAKLEREVLTSERLYQSAIFDLVREEVRLDDDVVIRRDFVDHPGAVAIVALREPSGAPEVLLIRQYRHPVRAALWEVPAGLLDVAGEAPLAAAQRELAEEADLTASRWDVLTDYFTSPGASNESLRIYLAREVAEVPEPERHTRVEEEAEMISCWVPLDEAVAAVHAGRIHNPSAVIGILAAASARSKKWAGLRSVEATWLQ